MGGEGKETGRGREGEGLEGPPFRVGVGPPKGSSGTAPDRKMKQIHIRFNIQLY